jgi:NitT/TauT family transport system substrate-binding protein
MISQHPEQVRAFIAAFLHGVQDSIEDPNAAYEICKTFVDSLAESNADVQHEVLNLSIEYWQADQPGFSQQAAWENMQSVLLDMGLLTSPLDLGKAYTNDFLP